VITFRPCEPYHITMIEAQAAQRGEYAANALVTDELVDGSLVALSAWSHGKCLAAGGLRQIWSGRAAAWALFSPQAGPYMLVIARKLKFVLKADPTHRIEMTVRADFIPGCKLAWLLGFELETPEPMKAFFPDGCDAFLFARVKP
jgi:hypothetical protein